MDKVILSILSFCLVQKSADITRDLGLLPFDYRVIYPPHGLRFFGDFEVNARKRQSSQTAMRFCRLITF
jgi:hypothetical protein